MFTDTLSDLILAVAALNLVTKSPILIPAWPSAGPKGGAGVALAASICNFIFLIIFLAIFIFYLLNLFYLQKIQFHRRFASKHIYQYFNFSALFVNTPDFAFQIFKGYVHYN